MKEVRKNAKKGVIELESRLQTLDIDYKSRGISSIEHIKGRVKSETSIKEKLIRKGVDVTPLNVKKYVHDVAGVRATMLFVDDVYRLYNDIKSQKDLEIIRTKDYIKSPKKSGYQSLHVNILVPIKNSNEKVEVELQIRTVGMDFFASVEHLLKYKRKDGVDKDISQKLINCSNIIASLDKEMSEIHSFLN